MAGRVITTCMVCTRLGLRTVLGLGVRVSVRKLQGLSHGWPYAHTTPLFVSHWYRYNAEMWKVKCGMKSAECTCRMVCRMRNTESL